MDDPVISGTYTGRTTGEAARWATWVSGGEKTAVVEGPKLRPGALLATPCSSWGPASSSVSSPATHISLCSTRAIPPFYSSPTPPCCSWPWSRCSVTRAGYWHAKNPSSGPKPGSEKQLLVVIQAAGAITPVEAALETSLTVDE